MKLCTRHKVFAFILILTLILFAILLVLDYETILTTYAVTNGVKKVVYTPIWEAIGKLFVAIAFVFTLWELAIRYNGKKIAAHPELQSYRIRRFFINGYFFLLSLVAPLACILTLILS